MKLLLISLALLPFAGETTSATVWLPYRSCGWVLSGLTSAPPIIWLAFSPTRISEREGFPSELDSGFRPPEFVGLVSGERGRPIGIRRFILRHRRGQDN